MSAGKSEVVRWDFDKYEGLIENDKSGDYVKYSDYAALESLLLDARAELAAKDEAYRLQFEACASLNGKLERAEALANDRLALLLDARATGLKLMGDLQRAEALAGGHERDARRYRIWRDRSNPQTDALRIEAADLYGDDLDTAIDAVGGRGE